jgi:hypothetical protein
MTQWGLVNGHLEEWGDFGRGWSLKRFSAEIIEPQSIPLIAFPRAWSPGLAEPLEAEVVWLNVKSRDEMESYTGKLKGKIVLIGNAREIRPLVNPSAVRFTQDELNRMSQARPVTAGQRGGRGRGPATTQAAPLGRGTLSLLQPATGPTTAATNPATALVQQQQVFSFAIEQECAMVVTSSTIGDGGTIFVQGATLPAAGGRRGGGAGGSAWETNARETVPQITIAAEQFNRLTRILQAGETVKMAVNLKVEFHADDIKAYNTIAEIPGTDLKDQVVMLGGHLDSWHSGTGATDNGAGVAVAMEAVRILKTLGLQPRRTIRVGLWTGEEEGIFGSRGYVQKHFGAPAPAGRRGGRGGRGAGNAPTSTSAPASTITPEYDKFSVYFNLDNGTGKIRGVYLQNNENVRPIFRAWLAPFKDLGADTLTISNTSGTDHLSFDAVGLPGFQFIQDQVEYNTRTHHSNMDVFDRIQADDLKQAAAIMASFVYNASMMDQRMPRK